MIAHAKPAISRYFVPIESIAPTAYRRVVRDNADRVYGRPSVVTIRLILAQIVTTDSLIIVWDEPKREANLAKHGIDFADIGEEFFLSAVTGPAKDGRHFALGELNGMIVVIFAILGTEGLSIISARPASRKERRLLS